MNIHKNARLTPRSRADLVRRVVEESQAPRAVATAFGVSIKTIGKWVERFKAEGPQGIDGCT
jgi:transposase